MSDRRRVVFTQTGEAGSVIREFTQSGAGDLDGPWLDVQYDDGLRCSAPAGRFHEEKTTCPTS